MGWFERSPERKAVECEDCARVLKSRKPYSIDDSGHLVYDFRKDKSLRIQKMKPKAEIHQDGIWWTLFDVQTGNALASIPRGRSPEYRGGKKSLVKQGRAMGYTVSER